MAYVEGEDRGQMALFPASIEEYIDQDSPVRVIDAFVQGLDMVKLGFVRGRAADTGRPGYDPRDLLRLYLYGYLNGLRSSRRLAAECKRNLEIMFLLNKLTPDFRTISDFRKDNVAALKQAFDAFVRFCDKQSLFGKELLAIDGTKIRASNAKRHAYNKKMLEDKIARIDAHVEEWLEELDKRDAEEKDEPRMSKEEIAALVEELSQRKATYEGYLEQIGENRETQLLTTDPEARVMKSKDGFHPSFNVQTAVDAKNKLIAEIKVTNSCNDLNLMHELTEDAKEKLDVTIIEVDGDKGYDDNNEVKKCLLDGTLAHVAIRNSHEERIVALEHKQAKIDEATRASEKPEDIQKCLKAGVLPDCYRGKGIEVRLETPDDSGKDLSYFIRNKDNTVTCPMGQILRPVRQRGTSTIYQNARACHMCKRKCGSFLKHKTVLFARETQAVAVKMPNGSNKDCKIQKLPPGVEVNPGNHNLYRADSGGRPRVLIIIKADKYRQLDRKCIVEHPFGTIKRAMGFTYFLLRGVEKTQGEASLMGLAYNMKRAINILGAPQMIAALSG